MRLVCRLVAIAFLRLGSLLGVLMPEEILDSVHVRFWHGKFELNGPDRKLLNTTTHTPLQLAERYLTVLAYLLSRPGRLRTYRDFEVDLYINKGSVQDATSKIRQLFEENGLSKVDVGNLIYTVRGSGVRCDDKTVQLVTRTTSAAPPMISTEKFPEETAEELIAAHPDLAEQTYVTHRRAAASLINLPTVINSLCEWHNCEPYRLGKRLVPATLIWDNSSGEVVQPDRVLNRFDDSDPHSQRLSRSLLLDEAVYPQARKLIKSLSELPECPIQHEGLNYVLTRFDFAQGDPIPKIDGRFGWYYDNLLTQYALEWELRKYLASVGPKPLQALPRSELPLRKALSEKVTDPLRSGEGRVASITVSTLVVFPRPNKDDYHCIVSKRSSAVAVSAHMLHVAPAGMFEAANRSDKWSVEENVFRELLEEAYGEQEQSTPQETTTHDPMYAKEPILTLQRLMQDDLAFHSVSGICVDLLNLRTEICTVLLVLDEAFSTSRAMKLNWEYVKEGPAGTTLMELNQVEEFMRAPPGQVGIVASGAVCIGLGYEWVKQWARKHPRKARQFGLKI